MASAILYPRTVNVNTSIPTESLSINDLLENIECLTKYIISRKHKNYMSKLLEQINMVNKKTDSLASFIDLIGGGTPKTTVKEYWNGDIPWLSVVDFNNDSRWVSDAEKKITKEGIQNSSTRILNKDDIIISARGTVGVLAQLSRPMAFNQSCYGIRAKDDVDQSYLFYLLKSSVPKLTQIVHGAVFDTITKDSFEQVNVSVPDIQTQKKIAEILSSYDLKIENNNNIIKNLELTAQTIFNEWFVNFKFPGYEKVIMVDSEMGEIPEGWGVGNIETICNRLPSGKVFKENELSLDGSTPVYDQSSKGTIGFHAEEPAFNADIDNPILTFGDHTCRVQLISEPFSLGPNTIPLSGSNNYSPIFTFFLIKDLIEQREYKRHWNELVSNNLIIPEIGIVNQYTKIIKPFIKEINFLEKEKTFLKSQRNQLLAKLI